jgi:hypothetical protein
MKDLQLKAGQPLAMRFAADARLSRIDYTDDQSWEIVFGSGNEPALCFQTRYGGRAGMVRIVPMFIVGSSAVYEANGYTELPTLVAFAPNYARVEARPRPDLRLTADLWLMDSHCVGGRFTLTNDSGAELPARIDLVAQAVRDELPVKMNLLTLENAEEALHLGLLGGLNPVMLIEQSALINSHPDRARPKLTASMTLLASGSESRRWVVCGEKMRQDSLVNGYQWLYDADWEAELARMQRTHDALPTITTGDADIDATLAWSRHVLLRSFIGATKALLNPSFVSARIPSRGYSPNGTGSDHGWQWNGQDVREAYVALPAAAIFAPDLAKAAFRNWLLTATPDGGIDAKPGAAGQRANQLCPPLLAHIAWRIYENTGDRAFIEEVYPALAKAFERWFGKDRDADGDGYPEWADDAHSGYSPNPSFGRNVRWAQGAELRKAETPDLGAALVHDGLALMEMAALLGKAEAMSAIQARLDALSAAVEGMWSVAAGSYLHRDRDTHQTPAGADLFQGKGDEAFDARPVLDPPNRLLLRVVGGTSRPPNAAITIEGLDHAGNPVNETLAAGDMAWGYGSGTVISTYAYQQVNYVKFSGLSRVFTTEISTLDLTRQNLTHLAPLWAGIPDPARAERLRHTLNDPTRYGRKYGWSMCPANDPSFKANNVDGSGGVWAFWQTILIEGLLRYGFVSEAAAQFDLLLRARIASLKEAQALFEAYDCDKGGGLGDPDELLGIVPFDLLLEALGVRVLNARQAAVGPFAFAGTSILASPITLAAQRVTVAANAVEVTITFASGHTQVVARPGAWVLVDDPTPEPEKALVPATPLTTPADPVPAVAVELPPDPLTDLTDIVAAENAPPRTVPLVTINDPDVPDTSTPPPPIEIIPVQSKKDDTVEIEVSQSATPPPPPSDSDQQGGSGTFKIPIKGE